MSHARLLSFVLAAAAALGASCTSSRRDDAIPSPPVGFTVSDAMNRAHFAFHEDHGAFLAGHRSYVVRVSGDGAVRLTPRWEKEQKRRTRREPIRVGEPAVTLRTLAVERGAPFSLASPSVQLAADGTMTIDRGLVVEHVGGDVRGVEQSWSFARAPAGSGDLVVRVALETKGRVETVESGIRVVDPVSTRAVRYDSATWIDAAGTRTTLPIALVDGSATVRVPAEVLEKSMFPAVLDPTISPEFSVDDPIIDLPGYWFYGPDAVAGGKNGTFLTSWEDERVFSVDDNVYFGSQQVFGARVSANGTVLDPNGFVIAATRDFDIDHSNLTFDGTNWFASWTQYPYNSPCTEEYGTRVAEDGTVLDPQNVFISCVPGNAPTWLGYDGKNYLAAWLGSSLTVANSNAMFGQYVTTAGARTAGAPMTILDGLAWNGYYGSLLGCDGVTTCMWVYGSANGLRARRIPQSGVVSSELTLTSTSTDSAQSLTYDGTNFVLGYSTSSGGTRAMRITPSTGVPVDAAGISLGGTVIDAVASTPGQTLFVWTDSTTSQIKGARFSSAGVLLDSTPLALTTAANTFYVQAGASSTQYLLAWQDSRYPSGPGGRPNRDTIFVGRVSTAGVALDGDGKNARSGANGQRTAGLDGDATGWLVAWEDLRTREYYASIRAARLDATGKTLDPSSFELAPIGNNATVAYNGADGYLVTYSNAGEFNGCGTIQGNLVTKATGAVAPTFDIAGNCNVMPRVIWDGTQYVVVWIGSDVRMARVSKTGTILDAGGIQVGVNNSGWGEAVGVAFDGTNYFVAWSAKGLPDGTGIVGARVSKSGTVIDTTPIVINQGPYDVYGPTVAWNGETFILAWPDYRNAFYTNSDIYYARVTSNGAVLDPNGKPLATGPAFQAFPTVISMKDGVSSLIAWAEPRRTDRFRDFGIFGSFIRNSDGKNLDPGGIALADLPGNELFPSLGPKSSGNAVLVYQRDESTTGLGAERVHGRFISSGTLLGQACTKNEDCSSRACADGICCDTPCDGTCQTCTATPGKCSPVKGAEDPGTCSGSSSCDATGSCHTKDGQSCTKPDDCMSGFCSAGLCCERACDGFCETCAAPPGKCTLRSARSTGSPSCAPYACDGVSSACPSTCASDESCPTNARCDVATGSCVEGAYCIDSKTLGGNGPIPSTCAPYTCESGACRTTCRDVHDCVFPAVCNEDGICMQASSSPVDLLEGCSMSSRRSSNATGGVLAMVALLLLRARSGRKSRERAG